MLSSYFHLFALADAKKTFDTGYPSLLTEFFYRSEQQDIEKFLYMYVLHIISGFFDASEPK